MEITRRHWIVAGVLLVSFVLALFIDSTIVTDRRRVRKVINDFASAFGKSDTDAIAAQLSRFYDDGILRREEVVKLASIFLNRFGPTDVKIREAIIKVDGRSAAADLDASAKGQELGGVFGNSQWRVHLRKELDDHWRIVAIRPLSLGEVAVEGWREMGAIEMLRNHP